MYIEYAYISQLVKAGLQHLKNRYNKNQDFYDHGIYKKFCLLINIKNKQP